jgi:hypothetical protein
VLSTDDVLVLGKVLRPPEGYGGTALMAWSYSLDLGMALALPLSFLRGRDRAGDDPDDVPPWDLIEALRTRRNDFRIFCNASSIYPPSKRVKHLLPFLQSMIVPVAMPEGSLPRRPSFHPKLVVAKYTAPGEPTRLRVVCMSRNLTTGGSLDISVAVDGGVAPGRKEQGSDELADAIETVGGWSMTDEHTSGFLKSLAEAVRNCVWDVPGPFTSLRFIPLGFSREQPDPAHLIEDEHRILIVSPFLHRERLDTLTSVGTGHILVSERAELRTVQPESLARFGSVMRLSGEGIGLAGLHAKLYVCEGSREARWLVGSANATKAAVTRNAELLVELSGPVNQIGIDRTLESGLGSLITAFQPGDLQERDEGSDLEDALDDLATHHYRAEVVASADDVFDVRILMDATPPAGHRVTVRFAAGHDEGVFDSSGVATVRVAFKDLSTFLVISLRDADPPLSRTVVAELIGVSLEELRGAIRRELVPDPLALLLALIAGAEDTLMPSLDFEDDAEERDHSDTDRAGESGVGPRLLEPLMRLLRDDGKDDGQRLDDLQARFEELREDLDADVVEMWDALMTARLR